MARHKRNTHADCTSPLPPIAMNMEAERTSGSSKRIKVAVVDLAGDGPLSIYEACAVTGLCRTLISERIKRGEIPARKAGRRTLVMRSDLRNWLDILPQIQPTNPKGDA